MPTLFRPFPIFRVSLGMLAFRAGSRLTASAAETIAACRIAPEYRNSGAGVRIARDLVP